MKPELLEEFRAIRKELFGNRKDLEITQAIVDNPLYPRYKTLAPEFYLMMTKSRKKHGLKV